MERDRNCLSYWFPKLVAAGVPVPRTEIVKTEVRLEQVLDGKVPEGYLQFVNELEQACLQIGACGPWFLRTGQGSGKHDWKRTCFVADLTKLRAHVAALVEWSHLVDFLGLRHDVWCVREMLPTKPIDILPRYGDMPLVREMRCFVKGGEIVCVHPYWPQGSIEQGLDRKELQRAQRSLDLFTQSLIPIEQTNEIYTLARQVAEAFKDDGAWSVDILETKNGWYVTDMAEARRSFHWEGCERAKEFTS